MKYTNDLIGRRFNQLTVIGRAPDQPGRKVMFACNCDCGGSGVFWKHNLLNGNTASCGCLRARQLAERNRTKNVKHGLTGSNEYRIWSGMRNRCENTQNPDYQRYGARGIKVCERWADFAAFLADMGPRPTDKHSVERSDNDGDYGPGNCRWATYTEQAANRRSTRRMTAGGVTKPVAQWARELGMPSRVLRDRKRLGWSDEKCVHHPYLPLQAKGLEKH